MHWLVWEQWTVRDSQHPRWGPRVSDKTVYSEHKENQGRVHAHLREAQSGSTGLWAEPPGLFRVKVIGEDVTS